MRRKAATAALACLLLSAPLLAKPTRTITRSSRYAAPPATLHASRLHAAKRTEAARSEASLHAHSAARTNTAPARREIIAARISSRPQTRGLTQRGSSLAAQVEFASRAAILAADQAATRGKGSRAAAHEQSAPSSATYSSPARSADSPLLVNDGGMLRPLPPGQRPPAAGAETASPFQMPSLHVASLYDSRGRLVIPPPLRGSHEVLLHQNEMADHDGLSRIQDDADLLDLRREKKLVPLPESDALTVDFRLPLDRRYSRPWTAAFLAVLARNFYAAFHAPLQVDSAVRTIAVQQRLVRTNGNAAPTTGDTASPHLTGQAVDIAKGNLNRTQIAWLRTYLQPLIDQGTIDVEEEFQQACFHISVYKSFLPNAARIAVAAARQLPADPLAGGSPQ